MALPTGSHLGAYEILGLIGAGGMGEVYRARDPRLAREVAIKVLPPEFVRDPERLARFEREARVLASLNHPNIAAIYGFEQSEGVPFLVLEFVPGETVEGPLPVPEALAMARQIAEALEAAHEKGVIHRDLKPANIKVTPEGKIKVLDFGLAKALADDAFSADPARSPTLTAMATRAGVILGTAGYMSPEQARGKTLDRRSDIWAFGCVLFELLVGRRVFERETVTDTLAAVVEREPDWEALPASVPANIRVLLRRCLEKDLQRRMRDAWSARVEIEDALSAGSKVMQPAAEPAAPARTRKGQVILWTLLAAFAGVVATRVAGRLLSPDSSTEERRPVRLTMTLPPRTSLRVEQQALALSPDGSRLLFVARSEERKTTQVYLRSLDQFESKPVAGTEGAISAFFSPDGQWIGFFAGGKLRKVSAAGGPVLTLCDAVEPMGGSWDAGGAIFFTPRWSQGISRVSSGGGPPQAVSKPDPARSEVGHHWPLVLPGGKGVILAAARFGFAERFNLDILTTETGQRRTLVEGGSHARYLPGGQLLFARGGALLTVPFDLARMTVTGSPQPVLEGVSTDALSGLGQFDVSGNGTLAYVPGRATLAERSLVWVDRKGTAQTISELRRPFEDLALSPDGRRLALTLESPAMNVWIYEFARGTLSRLTFELESRDPVWTPDGKRVVYGSTRDGRHGLFWKPVDGSGPEERLTSSEYLQFPQSISPDGRLLAFGQTAPATGDDLWVTPLTGDRKPRALLTTKFNEDFGMFSPDGRWLAYNSNESGREEVYVQEYKEADGKLGAKWQVSTDGGTHPVWASGGRELFYRNEDKTFVVPVETRPTFQPANPRLLFEGRYLVTGHHYDVTPAGDRFIFIREIEQQAAPTQIHVVLNWFEELKRKADR